MLLFTTSPNHYIIVFDIDLTLDQAKISCSEEFLVLRVRDGRKGASEERAHLTEHSDLAGVGQVLHFAVPCLLRLPAEPVEALTSFGLDKLIGEDAAQVVGEPDGLGSRDGKESALLHGEKPLLQTMAGTHDLGVTPRATSVCPVRTSLPII